MVVFVTGVPHMYMHFVLLFQALCTTHMPASLLNGMLAGSKQSFGKALSAGVSLLWILFSGCKQDVKSQVCM